ncbi:DUF3798 domain-containing protein [Peptacetobacter hominis]|uniref:DUF3798 domain-containing protein n=1 Tax=Peptacetobacter hominis TaxID=2743610 RepID=A0A544QUW2_9FIRM|nr:DUF3798 domain-containing protein [Peptacetobacter hominis]TQQ84488.1 DUF3798 domain-containing protein [Peptacetobacter hominis]
MKNKIIMSLLGISIIFMSTGFNIKAEDKEDLEVKVAIVTEPSKEDPMGFSAADYISNAYKQRKINNVSNDTVEHIILPYDFDKNSAKTEKTMEKIYSDSEIDAVVFTTKKSGITSYVKELEEKRKDIITLSADVGEDYQTLVDAFDLNYISDNRLDGRKTVQLAKEMGAEAFILYYTADELKNEDVSVKISQIESECEKQKIELVKTEIPSGDIYRMKKYVSEDINKKIDEYGEDINIYTTNKEVDDVILKRGIKSGLIISEVSDGCLLDELNEMYRIYRRTWDKGDYKGNTKYITDSSLKYEMSGRLGGILMQNDTLAVYAATDIAIALKEEGADISRAYNSYFLETSLNVKEGMTAEFSNVIAGNPSLKMISVDQVIY